MTERAEPAPPMRPGPSRAGAVAGPSRAALGAGAVVGTFVGVSLLTSGLVANIPPLAITGAIVFGCGILLCGAIAAVDI